MVQFPSNPVQSAADPEITERFAAGSGAEIRLERSGRVATLVIDRPAQRNALGISLCARAHELIDEIDRDPGIGVLVVTGGGHKSFVSGADIGELVEYTPAEAHRHIEIGHTLFTRIERLPICTVAAINGYCLGGGLELAMACDIRLASANAKLGLPEITIAMVPGWGGVERLQRLIGQSRAAAMILTGELIDVAEAVACGLVHRQYDSVAALRAGTDELAARLAGFSPLSMRAAKQMVIESSGLSPEQTLQRDAAVLAHLMTTSDAREGLRAFLEKRPAQYRGQ